MHWWQSAVIYQVYPRSFQDTDGNGVGDLRGIIERLPHLGELGVDALWLSPIFASPMADFGYDISDYTAIDPLFGSMGDFDALLTAAHAQRLKLLLDFVPNHTSDQHAWFLESRSSRDNAKRDWYIWRDPAPDGGPPNNWLSEFGGSAWQFDAATGQYYYHAFLSAQPDLNWRNPDVREAMHETMRFWLRRGVDGFRVDVIWHLMKDELFRDNPPNPDYRASAPPNQRLLTVYSSDRPEVHDIIRGLRQVIDEFPERLLIGEIYLPFDRLAAYYGHELSGAHLPFNFSLLDTPWNARAIAALIDRYQASLPAGAWPNWVLGNHDRPRLASRVGDAQTRIAAMLLLTLRGTPTLYYGEEIGMRQVAIAPGQVRDPFEKNVPGFGIGRDGCRTPMQWDGGAHAGFSTAEPWLPLADDFAVRNVACERADPASLYNLYRRLIDLRRARAALTEGAYRPVEAAGDVLAYERVLERQRLLVVLNFGPEPAVFQLPAGQTAGIVLIATDSALDGQKVAQWVTLPPHGGAVIKLGV
jgi:alpha-glucosidase